MGVRNLSTTALSAMYPTFSPLSSNMFEGYSKGFWDSTRVTKRRDSIQVARTLSARDTKSLSKGPTMILLRYSTRKQFWDMPI